MASITAVNWVQSLVFPPVRTNASGRPIASQARWALLVLPPRDGPRAGLWRPLFGPRGVLRSVSSGSGRLRWRNRTLPRIEPPLPQLNSHILVILAAIWDHAAPAPTPVDRSVTTQIPALTE